MVKKRKCKKCNYYNQGYNKGFCWNFEVEVKNIPKYIYNQHCKEQRNVKKNLKKQGFKVKYLGILKRTNYKKRINR